MSNTETQLKEQPKKQPKKVKVALKKAHTHAGVDYQPKDVVEVREDQRKRLVELGVV